MSEALKQALFSVIRTNAAIISQPTGLIPATYDDGSSDLINATPPFLSAGVLSFRTTKVSDTSLFFLSHAYQKVVGGGEMKLVVC